MQALAFETFGRGNKDKRLPPPPPDQVESFLRTLHFADKRVEVEQRVRKTNDKHVRDGIAESPSSSSSAVLSSGTHR